MDAGKAMENWQYNVVSLVNVSDHAIGAKSIKYKNDIDSDKNLFFFSVPEIQHGAVELSITKCIGNGETTLSLHFHAAAQRTGKSKIWLISMVTCTGL